MIKIIFTVFLLFLNIILNSLASIFLKTSSKIGISGMGQIAKLLMNSYFLSGLVSFGLSFIAYNIVLKYMNVNIAYPIVVSGSIILVTILSKIFLKEPSNAVQISGLIIIILGVLVLTVGNFRA